MCAIASFFDNLNSPTPTAQVQVLNVNRFLKKQTEMSELVARTGRHQQRYEDGYRLIAGFLMLLAMRLAVLMDRFLLRYCTGYKKLSRVPEIMSVIWKRINDTGKNWRHVYKALTILEYLVAHGSERVIDEIREHAYQISALSDFQYIDSRGKDHGSNVRKKSQSLVVLVNDKERIQEARQKAAANRDKCC